MADTDELVDRETLLAIDQHPSGTEDEYQYPESPGTRKLEYLKISHSITEEPQSSGKLVERPISSGLTELQPFTYGAAPKRSLNVHRKATAALFPAPDENLPLRVDSISAKGGHLVIKQPDNRVYDPPSSVNKVGMHDDGSSAVSMQDSELCVSNNVVTLPADDFARDDADQEGELRFDDQPRATPASTRPAPTNMLGNSMTGRRVDRAPHLGQSCAKFCIAPISPVGPHRPSVGAVISNDEEASNVSQPTTVDTKTSAGSEQKESPVAACGVVDLTINDYPNEDSEPVANNRTEDDSLTDVEFPTADPGSSSTEPRRKSIERTRRSRLSAGSSPTALEKSLQPVNPGKVVKRNAAPQQPPLTLPPGTSAAPSGRSPSEEDLYYLLLHRYRKREHTEKQLATRLRQLENENTELGQAARQYQQQLQSSNTSANRQAAQIRQQNGNINNIKECYSKIKDFMKKVCDDQLSLKDKAESIDREKQTLRAEYIDLRRDLEDAKNTTATSSNAINKIKGKIAEFRHDAVLLETSLGKTKLDLQNKQSLLTQEQRRNTRFENHIAELTRKHNGFSSEFREGSQRLQDILQGMSGRLGNLEKDIALPAQPPNLPAMDQCVEMLKELTKTETATPADITDMIQVVQALSESVDSFQQQSEESSRIAAIARAEAHDHLLSQITTQLTSLVHDFRSQDQSAQLREAKATLEERVKANENMLLEIRSGKASAEKREEYLRVGTDKLLEELAELREAALTPKRSSGPTLELQTLLIKWTSANKLLAESQQRIEISDQKLQKQDEQIRSLSNQLTEAIVGQENSNREIASFNERRTEMENMNWEGKQLLAENEELIRYLQQELTRSEEEYSDLLNESGQVRSVHETLLKELDERDCRLSRLGRDYAVAKSTMASLSQNLLQMDDLREEAARTPDLIHQGEVKDAEIKGLRRGLEKFDALSQENDYLRVEIGNKTEQMMVLHANLESAEEVSRQLSAVRCELAVVRQDNDRLDGAHERASTLETEVNQQNHKISQLDLEVANLQDALGQLNGLQMEVDRSKNDLESMKKDLKAAEEEAARARILERTLLDQESHVRELTAKLAEAHRIAKDVPELQVQMDQFSPTFDGPRYPLDDSHTRNNEKHSTNAANTKLKQTIQELQERVAVTDGAAQSVQCLMEEIKGGDIQMKTLRAQLHHGAVKTQQKQAVGHAAQEDNLHNNPPLGMPCLREDNATRRERAGQDTNSKALENQAGSISANGNDPRKKKKRANRNTSTSQTKDSTLKAQELGIEASRSPDSGLHLPGASAANEGDRGHVCPAQDPAQIDLIPDSQPCTIDVRNNPFANNQPGKSLEQALSSSPLSDIGELFDSSDPIHLFGDESCGSPDEPTSQNNVEVARSEDQVLEHCESAFVRHNHGQSSHSERLRSSSCGGPLLLDDLEGLGSLPSGISGDSALEKLSNPDSQDGLSSPVGKAPEKLARKGTYPWAAAAPRSNLETKQVGSLQYGRQVAEDPSPRRLRRRETDSRRKPIRSSHGSGHDAADMRASTPKVPPKEKHQPNSAIKRKAEAAVAAEESGMTEKKRVKRNLSNIEVANRPRTSSQSLQSSSSSGVEQSLSRMRQSSTSTASSSRSTIVGKNAPAPGTNKRAKKPRGGSKSQRYAERFGAHSG